jgi:hypothetical protein
MGPAMALGTHSQAAAAPVAAEPERKAAPSPAARALPDTVLLMQKTAGNAAVARAVAAPKTAAVQRCGAGCGCATCSPGEELLEDEKLGAGLLRSAVARRSP